MIYPKTPNFYISPKIHNENNTGKCVVNSVTSHTSWISHFVDHHLQPFVKEIQSCIKYTKDFLLWSPENPFIVIKNVKTLCTRIPNEENIAAVE